MLESAGVIKPACFSNAIGLRSFPLGIHERMAGTGPSLFGNTRNNLEDDFVLCRFVNCYGVSIHANELDGMDAFG